VESAVPVAPIADTGISDNVLDEPEIVLFVNVWVSVSPTTPPVGAVFPAKESRSASQACTVDPTAAEILASARAFVKYRFVEPSVTASVVPGEAMISAYTEPVHLYDLEVSAAI